MAFSLRKMLSNMNYFKKPDDEVQDDKNSSENASKKRRHTSSETSGDQIDASPENAEPDSTSRIPTDKNQAIKYPSKKGSLSDTDLFTSSQESLGRKKLRCKNKKLKLDITKANKSMSEALNMIENIENTPKQFVFGCKSIEMFNERLKEFDLSKSFDIFDALSDDFGDHHSQADIESLSDNSDSDVSLIADGDEKSNIKMCRKVEIGQSQLSLNKELMIRSGTSESFGDVELEKTEDERQILLLSYQTKLEKIENLMRKVLQEFQFHIEVSKIFHTKSFVPALTGGDDNTVKAAGEINQLSITSNGPSPSGSWHVIAENEDVLSKIKVKKQLNTLKDAIEQFTDVYLQIQDTSEDESLQDVIAKTRKFLKRSLTYNKATASHKQYRVKNKRKVKRYSNYPDLKEALENLFSLDSQKSSEDSIKISTDLKENDSDKYHQRKCTCDCHHDDSQTDSGLMMKNDSLANQSISSSIGNFSLDNSELTAYSETLDLIVSYNSFNDSNLYNAVLEKTAIERLSFYVQAHSIQIRSSQNSDDSEPKRQIVYFCPVCSTSEIDEQGIFKHILSPKHCEKIHFQYKTAYIKKCLTSGKEIQPSTVLNSMTMYRDENKIVCFGDAMYACSLCFDNLIVGESVLMAHCIEPTHLEKKDMLADIFD